jgi:hypothetical protein
MHVAQSQPGRVPAHPRPAAPRVYNRPVARGQKFELKHSILACLQSLGFIIARSAFSITRRGSTGREIYRIARCTLCHLPHGLFLASCAADHPTSDFLNRRLLCAEARVPRRRFSFMAGRCLLDIDAHHARGQSNSWTSALVLRSPRSSSKRPLLDWMQTFEFPIWECDAPCFLQKIPCSAYQGIRRQSIVGSTVKRGRGSQFDEIPSIFPVIRELDIARAAALWR